MQKEYYVPPDLSLQMQELGFNEPCSAWWLTVITFAGESIIPVYEHKPANSGVLNAPIFAQCRDWFIKNYGIFGSVNQSGDCENRYSFRIYKTSYPHQTIGRGQEYDYYEAEIECLKMMIEITKNK